MNLAVACVPTCPFCTYTNVYKTINDLPSTRSLRNERSSKNVFFFTVQHPINGRKFTLWNYSDPYCAQARFVIIFWASILIA